MTAWRGSSPGTRPKVGANGGGEYGPYRQSERGHLYKEYVQRLLDTGRAYEKDGAIWFKPSASGTRRSTNTGRRPSPR